jgi:hypothetical protein
MSSLIFFTDESQAFVATDTLAVEPDGTPLFFSSKAQYLPHLSLIVAGTGAGGFSCNWTSLINSRMLVQDIEHLDQFAPDALRKLWETYRSEIDVPESITTTIYHFGVSISSGHITSFAYRSTNNFSSEPLEYGTGVKPECAVAEGNLYELVEPMMLEQRQIQASKPAEERIYIGGEAYALHLTPTSFNCVRLFEFDDYEQHQRQAYKGFPTAR